MLGVMLSVLLNVLQSLQILQVAQQNGACK